MSRTKRQRRAVAYADMQKLAIARGKYAQVLLSRLLHERREHNRTRQRLAREIEGNQFLYRALRHECTDTCEMIVSDYHHRPRGKGLYAYIPPWGDPVLTKDKPVVRHDDEHFTCYNQKTKTDTTPRKTIQ